MPRSTSVTVGTTPVPICQYDEKRVLLQVQNTHATVNLRIGGSTRDVSTTTGFRMQPGTVETIEKQHPEVNAAAIGLMACAESSSITVQILELVDE